MTQATIIPNLLRPGVGRQPYSEPRRPWLPQHSRLCPVLEAGSALGYLVYPPLEDNESYQVRYFADGSFQFAFFVHDAGGNPHPAFVLVSTPAGAGAGFMADDLVFRAEQCARTDAEMRALRDALITNVNTPRGGVGLRGAFDFRTPDGWDTVYTGVLNQPEPPQIPVLTARIQTDWYAHDTEFRYVLPPGSLVSGRPNVPVGQVFFVPRDEIRLFPASEGEPEAFRAGQREYWVQKARDQQATPYGLKYSPLYRKLSRRSISCQAAVISPYFEQEQLGGRRDGATSVRGEG